MLPDSINLLDELTREGLQSFRDSWFHCLSLATFAVAIGVALEGPEVFHEVKSALCTERQKPKWMVVAGLIGWLLIVGGVIGEYFLAEIVSKADGLIQTFDNIQLRATEKQSEEANDRAITAFNEATEAFRQSRDASKAAASAETRLARLRREAAPRRLTLSQIDKLATLLSAHPFGVVIASRVLDGESRDFADDFDTAIHDKAHWKTLRSPDFLGSEYGVWIATVKGTGGPEIKLLSDALTSIHIAHDIRTVEGNALNRISSQFQPGVLYLVIGAHPPIPPDDK